MSTIVRNEADLDTLLDENLVTEDYALEVLGLKNIADFRKFSRSFMKLSKIVKGIDDSNNEKLDKGLLPSTLSTAEKIVSALQANGGLKFDPDLLYLNDEGTKKVGYYYLDRLKNGIFECLVETTTTVNDSSKFRDISNKASADRLDNLSEYQIVQAIPLIDVSGMNLDIKAYVLPNGVVLINSYIDSGSKGINGVNSNGFQIAKFDFNGKLIRGVMTVMTTNYGSPVYNIRLLSDGTIIIESTSSMGTLTRGGFTAITHFR